MMKNGFILLILVFSLNKIQSQIVASSCFGADSVIEKYTESAWFMARNYELAKNESILFDSIHIPFETKNKILDAIIAVYNTTGDERDSLFVFHDITSFIFSNMRKMIVTCDTGALWGKQLSLGNLNTGYHQLDSMLIYYHFDSIKESFVYPDKRWFTLSSDSFYNMVAVAQKFWALPGILTAGADGLFSPGNESDIRDSIGVNTVDLDFTYRNRKFWRYRVYNDCSVEFLGNISMGYYHFLGIQNLNETNIDFYPNPANYILNFTHSESLLSFTIYDITGNLIREEKDLNNIVEYDISDLKKGMYFIQLNTKDGIFTKKLIKD